MLGDMWIGWMVGGVLDDVPVIEFGKGVNSMQQM